MNGADEYCIKKGWLKKQGGIVRNWLDRWFVLKGKSLHYFTREDESKQQGTIELQNCKLAEIPFNRDEPDRWLLEISHVPRGVRANETFLLWADSEALRTEWVAALRRAVYAHIGGGVFGGPLLDTMYYDHQNYGCDVPHIVKGCVDIILENKEVEGIFRLSGRVSQVKEMRRRYDEGQRPNFIEECMDVHTAASLLKLFFRELPEPVIPFEHFEAFLNLATSFRYNSNHNQTLRNLKVLVHKIPKENYRLLDYLTAFLYEISKYQQVNKMTERNIALIFGTNILRALDNSPEFEMATQNLTTHVVLALVKWRDSIFTDSTEISIDEQAIEEIVNLSEEPVQDTPNSISPSAATVDDLRGIDFTNAGGKKNMPQVPPPPIPARTKDLPLDVCSVSSDPEPSNGTSVISLPNDSSSPKPQPVPAPRGPDTSIVRTRPGGSIKNKARPVPMARQESSELVSPRAHTLPITKVERVPSNFTSFIDSPLDDRVSLNIGDLPNSVEDLQALILTIKIEVKQLRVQTSTVTKENEVLRTKHKQQVENLASTICKERETKDEAVARVVKLTNELARYQSVYGPLDDEK